MLNLADIPGLAKAQAWEASTRAEAFLDVPRELCGVEVVPLTLHRLGILLAARNPFFCGGLPTAESVAIFLWVASLHFDVRDAAKREAFVVGLRASDALADLSECTRQISDYLDEMLLDAPMGGGSDLSVPITSSDAIFVDLFADAYGWTIERTMHAPLPCIYQCLRCITRRKNPRAIFGNRRSGKVRDDWLLAHQAAILAAQAVDTGAVE